MSSHPLLLDVQDLHVGYQGAAGLVQALDGVSLQVERGERVGIVGESGSGKSQLLMVVMGLLDTGARTHGCVRLEGRELLGRPEAELDTLRGARMAMVFQDPMTALNPYLRIGTQLTEVLQRHRGLRGRAASDLAMAMLERLGIPDAADRMRRYPHEFSGGMRQRVMIAIALLAEPALLLADEPTTALDVTVQAQILDLLRELAATLGTGLVLVTHDLGVVARVCERVVVMYGGQVMESAAVDELFAEARHPYTQALLASTPRMDTPTGQPLRTLAGQPRGAVSGAHGCPFAPRCERADAHCHATRPPLQVAGKASLACHRATL